MAEFAQSPASRAAVQDAARSYFLSGKSSERAKEFGVTQRTVNRWRASLESKSSQKRNPLAKASKFSKRKVTVKVKADYAAGGDSAYLRKGKPMQADVPADFFRQALTDPDAAWETFLDSNVYPRGTVENVRDIRFS